MGKRKQKKLKRTPEEQALRIEKLRVRQRAAAKRRRQKKAKAKAEGYRWETYFIHGKMKQRKVYLHEDERTKFPCDSYWGYMENDGSTMPDPAPPVDEDPPEAFPTVSWWTILL